MGDSKNIMTFERCEVCNNEIIDIMYIKDECYETENGINHIVYYPKEDAFIYACMNCIECHNLRIEGPIASEK